MAHIEVEIPALVVTVDTDRWEAEYGSNYSGEEIRAAILGEAPHAIVDHYRQLGVLAEPV